MELIRQPGSRRVVAFPGTTAGERHGEILVIPYERSNRARRCTNELLGVIRELDTATGKRIKQKLLDLVGGLRNDPGGGMSAGLFTKRWFGESYLDHTPTFSSDIIRHFKRGESVSPEFAMARLLARNDVYTFIGVYSDGAAIPARPDNNPVT